MNKYLYVFGYESPELIDLNDRRGWDIEFSQCVFIVADSEARALEWGRKISEQFIRVLFEDPTANYRWADFIETNLEKYTPQALTKAATVNYGEYPEWDWERLR